MVLRLVTSLCRCFLLNIKPSISYSLLMDLLNQVPRFWWLEKEFIHCISSDSHQSKSCWLASVVGVQRPKVPQFSSRWTPRPIWALWCPPRTRMLSWGVLATSFSRLRRFSFMSSNGWVFRGWYTAITVRSAICTLLLLLAKLFHCFPSSHVLIALHLRITPLFFECRKTVSSVPKPYYYFRFRSNFRAENNFSASFPDELNGSAEACSVALTHGDALQVPWYNFDLSELFGLGLAIQSFRFLSFTPLVFCLLGSHVSYSRSWTWVVCFQRHRYHCCCVSRTLFELVSGEALVSALWRIGRLTTSTYPCWFSGGDGMFSNLETPIHFL